MHRYSSRLVFLLLAATSFAVASGCAKMREEVKEATGQTETDWQEQRDKFVQRTNNRLQDISETVDELNVKKFNDRQKSQKARESVNRMQGLMSEVRQGLRSVQQSGPENWDNRRASVRTNLNRLESEYKEAQKMLE